MTEKEVPKFVPRPDQVDFSHARWAPVVNCVVMHGGKILIVERNPKSNFYPGYWNGVSGFLDDRKSLEEKVREELREEIGVGEEHILSIKLCGVFDQEEPEYGKTWIVHAVLAEVDTDEVTLDWEAHRHAWIDSGEVSNYKLMPGFDQVLAQVLPHVK